MVFLVLLQSLALLLTNRLSLSNDLDIMDKDLGQMRKDRWAKAFSKGDDESSCRSSGSKEDINRKASIVLEHLIQASGKLLGSSVSVTGLEAPNKRPLLRNPCSFLQMSPTLCSTSLFSASGIRSYSTRCTQHI